MTIQQGYNSYLGCSGLTSTSLVNTGATEFIYVDNMTFQRTQDISIVPEIGASRTGKRVLFGNVNATFNFTKNVDPNNGIGLYQFVLGGSLTSASVGSGTFTHTYSEGTETKTTNGNLRLQFEPQVGGDSATTRYWGMGLIDSYSLNVPENGLVKETFSGMVQNHGNVVNTLTAVSFTGVNPIPSTRAILKLGVTITTVSISSAQNITLNINNAIQSNKEIGTTTVKDFSFGQKTVSGSFNFVFQDYNHYNNFVNNTSIACLIELDGYEATSGTTHSIQFKLPEIFYTGSHPDVNGLGQIIQPINFIANYSSNASYQIQIVVTNSQSAGTL